MLGLAGEFGEFAAEVRAHFPHDLLNALQVARAEDRVAVLGDGNQMNVQDATQW